MRAQRLRPQQGNRTGILHHCDRGRTFSAGSFLWTHKQVPLGAEPKRIMANFMEIQFATKYAHSFFTVHSYPQHAGVARYGTESIRYNMYIIFHGKKMMDTVAFPYRWSFGKVGDLYRPFLLSSMFFRCNKFRGLVFQILNICNVEIEVMKTVITRL